MHQAVLASASRHAHASNTACYAAAVTALILARRAQLLMDTHRINALFNNCLASKAYAVQEHALHPAAKRCSWGPAAQLQAQMRKQPA